MKRTYIRAFLVFTCIIPTLLLAEQVDMGTINVEAKIDTHVMRDVRGEDIKSADLGEALFKKSPSISIVRRSGIANDVIIRGQKKDNINITIDGAKVAGACPNRMDPPISHVLANNIDDIEINEGPFNVQDFGVLSADIKIHTLKPSKKFKGDKSLSIGSWGYQKASLFASGAITEKVRVMISTSGEKSRQYEDGSGNTFSQQIQREIGKGANPHVQYQQQYMDMDSYTKKTILTKFYWDITDNQELRLGYTGNRSNDILYPSSNMDAVSDDTDIFNAEYLLKNLGTYSKEIDIQLYHSKITHPMSTQRRIMGTPTYMTNKLYSNIKGIKIKNIFDIDIHTFTIGIDTSLRNWDGTYSLSNNQPIPNTNSIWDVDTKNRAFFMEDNITFNKFVFELGLRYDNTKITSGNPNQEENKYNELNAFVMGTYHIDDSMKVFTGIGRSSRVPDAKELFWRKSGGAMAGTPDLKATKNTELDIGIEKMFDNSSIKAKVFYSMLGNFIAYNSASATNNYENIDATLYGLEISGTYIVTASLYFDYGMACQKGAKKNPLKGQMSEDMPEIPPLKLNASANYDWDDTLSFRTELIAADSWSDFDSENGEQKLDSYAVLNLKGSKTWGAFMLTVGIDNVFNTTYAVSNTYSDLVLITANNNVMLMNEPGRYLYTNLKYTF
ncbi:MAG: TonB-dependent receptor [Candidatus Endonucleobacter sp. (ex Gigantidas childressi)]|nr:TonB-dependent receptor [Candidatus Endonucleobacter sp. (ex Gigantidas childressi)]